MASYEWDVEETEKGTDEIMDHLFCDSFEDAVRTAAAVDADEHVYACIVLVRDSYADRSWAYMKDGKLPEMFKDAMGVEVAKVPRRFHREVEKLSN